MKQVKHTYIIKLDGTEPYLGQFGAALLFQTYDGKYYINLGVLSEVSKEKAESLIS